MAGSYTSRGEIKLSINANAGQRNLNKSLFVVLLGFVLSLCMAIPCIISIGTDTTSSKQLFLDLFRIHKAVIVIVLYLTMSIVRNYIHKIKNRNYNAREMILIIGVCSIFQYFTYEILAGLLTNKLTTVNALGNCFNIGFEYLQIVCILQLNFVEFGNAADNRKQMLFLKSCIGLSFGMAFGLWLADSYVGISNYHITLNVMEDGLEKDAWTIIKHVIFPLLLFYRFSTFFAFANLFQRIR